MKKRISLLLACCLLLCMAPVALADADIQIEDGAAVELPQGLEDVEDGALELDPDALELDALLTQDDIQQPSAPAEDAAAQNAIGDIIIHPLNFPDDAFRKYIAEHCDTNHDGALSMKEFKAVKSLKLNGQNIKSLKGVDVFAALEELSCFDNKLTSLDVQGLKALKSLDCHDNKLTSLNVRGCKKLTTLLCEENKLKALDLTGDPALIHALKNGKDSSSAQDKKNAIYYVSGKGKIRFDDTVTITADGENLFASQGDKVSLKECKVEAIKEQTYTGEPITPSPVVRHGNKTLKQGIDFTVSYSNNKDIGSAEVIIKGKGLYRGTETVYFSINPRPVKLLSLRAGRRQLTAYWELSDGSGASFQLQYSRSRGFGGSKKMEVKSTRESQTIRSLVSGKTYYVRIRAFKKVGKVTYTSPWSGALSVKVE